MSTYRAGDRTPYVYVIKFVHPITKQKQWYIGSRYAAGCHPGDLLTTYTTSSKHFNELYREFGSSCFVGKVVKTFDSRNEAIPYEQKLFFRAESFGLKRRRELINRVPPGVKATEYKSDEWRQKLSTANLGKKNGPRSEETKRKIADANRGKVRTEEGRRNNSIAQTGKRLSDEAKANISKGGKGKRLKSYRFLDPQGQLHEFTGLSRFCAEHGLTAGNMSNVYRGGLKHHKGWTAA